MPPVSVCHQRAGTTESDPGLSRPFFLSTERLLLPLAGVCNWRRADLRESGATFHCDSMSTAPYTEAKKV